MKSAPRRTILVRRKYYDDGANFDAFVEIDDVFVGHANAARGNRLSDIFRLISAVNPIKGVLVTLK